MEYKTKINILKVECIKSTASSTAGFSSAVKTTAAPSPENFNDDTKDGSNGVIIAVICIVATAVIAAVVIFIVKKGKSKSQ